MSDYELVPNSIVFPTINHNKCWFSKEEFFKSCEQYEEDCEFTGMTVKEYFESKK
jgi:hypothetical protein